MKYLNLFKKESARTGYTSKSDNHRDSQVYPLINAYFLDGIGVFKDCRDGTDSFSSIILINSESAEAEYRFDSFQGLKFFFNPYSCFNAQLYL